MMMMRGDQCLWRCAEMDREPQTPRMSKKEISNTVTRVLENVVEGSGLRTTSRRLRTS